MNAGSEDFAQKVADLIRSKPTDEELFTFCEEHDADKVLLALQAKMDQVNIQRQNRKVQLLEDSRGASEQERADLQLDFETWKRNANCFYKGAEMAARKIKTEFTIAAMSGKRPLETLMERTNSLLEQVLAELRKRK